MARLEARHAQEAAALKEAVEEAGRERESALGKLRREQEAERERVKRAIAEMKKKLERWGARPPACMHMPVTCCKVPAA